MQPNKASSVLAAVAVAAVGIQERVCGFGRGDHDLGIDGGARPLMAGRGHHGDRLSVPAAAIKLAGAQAVKCTTLVRETSRRHLRKQRSVVCIPHALLAVPLAHQTGLLCFQEQFAVLKSHGSFSTRCWKGKNGKEGKKGKEDEREKKRKKSCCAML